MNSKDTESKGVNLTASRCSPLATRHFWPWPGYWELTRYNRPKSSDFLALNSSWDRMPLRSNSANRSIFANISVS